MVLTKHQNNMPEPNMTVAGFDRWTNSDAYKQYREYRGGENTGPVIRRTRRVLAGTASPEEVRKLKAYLARAKQQDAGPRRFGSGRSKVSAHTAALRNWGYDPTGAFR